ncbi:MAG TPA: methyltransferase domain-containing protein [Candidatus Sulfotelmatobacter sp.]|nr:methyltransferase domain-containing protein [Candidatus Sulfotelmatobacter sp.]
MLIDAPILTLDVDWAPDFMIDPLVDALLEAGVRSTWFVTHPSKAIDRMRQHPELFELGVHPNFLPGSSHGSTTAEVLKTCMEMVPEAQSFRTHSLVQSTPLLTDVMRLTKLSIDASLYLPHQSSVGPFQFDWEGHSLLRVPFHWEDDLEMARTAPQWRLGSSSSSGEVFGFHPIHIYLNSSALDAYGSLKSRFRRVTDIDRKSADAAVNPGVGTRSLFDDVIDRLRQAKDSVRLIDLRERWAMAAGEKISEVAQGKVKATNGAERLEAYRAAESDQRAGQLRERYEALDATNIYATSRDTNLRELEIGFIREHAKGPDVLDIGCGNGYTLISLARTLKGNLTGLDFSENMIAGAQGLVERFAAELLSRPSFSTSDVRHLPFPDDSFDTVISERLIFNLPTRADQEATIGEVHRVLRPGGQYLMVEGNEDGLRRLNAIRERVGLDAIPTADAESFSSLKLTETELLKWLGGRFEIAEERFFGTYYLISRVVHPLLVQPSSPRFDAPINAIARRIAEVLPDVGRIGHVAGYKLIALK